MAFNQYPIDYSSYQNVRCIASDCPPLTIVPRDLNGVPGPQYQNGDAEHINTAIDIFRTKLKDQKVRDSFKTVAYQYRSRVPNGWFTQDSPLPSLEKVTDDFINQICSVSFPIVFVDYAWENPDYQGFHTRRPWDGKFEPGHQAISINGKVSGTFFGIPLYKSSSKLTSHEMVDEMNAAFLTAFVDENMGRLFRAFQFKTVNTLLHGMCDVFFTYLTRGQRLTPTEINALTVGVPTPNGEAGRALESMIFGALESLIFGGTMHYFQDLASRNPVDSVGSK